MAKIKLGNRTSVEKKSFFLCRYVDIGVYGVPKHTYQTEKTTRNVEGFVRQNRGFQMMYADSYMTRSEFESMFDHTLYREMRARYSCADAFPEVYDKVNKKARA